MAEAEKDARRVRAAEAALGEIRSGMKLGLGTGRAAAHFIRRLGQTVRAGLSVTGIATSESTAMLAREVGIPLVEPDDGIDVDLVVDGMDEIDRSLRMVKGGGGALLREKIVASAAKRMIVIGEANKLVETLGAFPLPIEIVPFGTEATRRAIEQAAGDLGLVGDVRVRRAADTPFVTDGGHHIVDAAFGTIPDPAALAAALDGITGVVEHGLFLGLADAAYLGGSSGVTLLER